jgi:L-lactate dehydrogenase complex protein LldF
VKSTSHNFPANTRTALADGQLRVALGRAQEGFINNRLTAVNGVENFDQLRDAARDVKEHTLAHLDYYLELFETRATQAGAIVHWASTPAQAREIVVDICEQADAKTVTKGKSMVGEEIAINEALETAGLEVVETDLGEYIIQLADEPPSHIIAPAIHKTREQIGDLFAIHHAKHGFAERTTETPALVHQARQVLRSQFQRADVGITGANFLVAETGSTVIVTNEGNGDLSNTLPKVHIVTAGIEKVIPNFEDLSSVLRVLARSATGQEMSVYTTLSTGPKRTPDLDGPQEFHIVLLDNGRSNMLAGEYREMLRCIRCGACMNHCPVYGSIGGHAYGWVYPGPMGSVLTPLMRGLDEAHHLPNACTLNGRCEQVCPMSIPLPKMLRQLRTDAFAQHLYSARTGLALKLWVQVAKRPRLYHALARIGTCMLGLLSGGRGKFRWLPLAGGWTAARDLPAPQGGTFQARWRRDTRANSGTRPTS